MGVRECSFGSSSFPYGIYCILSVHYSDAVIALVHKCFYKHKHVAPVLVSESSLYLLADRVDGILNLGIFVLMFVFASSGYYG